MADPVVKKSLGQHWLNDLSSLNAVCLAASINPQDIVLEIGPGTGTLTKLLAKKAKQVIAVEFDPDLVKKLTSKQIAKNLQIIREDIRKFDLSKLPIDYKIVANIPYYLTAFLLRQLTETSNKPEIAVLLVQKEVAERVVAEPGQMSLISVIIQYYYEVSLGRVVPAKMFIPPPKVDSQILVLQKRLQLPFKVDSQQFFRLAKAGFSNRRKTLLNSLSAGLQLDRNKTEQLLLKAELSTTSRAQELALQDWYKLYISLPKDPAASL